MAITNWMYYVLCIKLDGYVYFLIYPLNNTLG